MTKPDSKPDPRDDRPDAWERFTRAVDIAAQTAPIQRKAEKKKAPRKKPSTSEKNAG